ncbi:MAG: GAF domain-containing sensor histidine kinase [Leptolyngbya sp.]|nr:GAF domain-containing sensor histidine kinase [Leptolyngbya sp.]
MAFASPEFLTLCRSQIVLLTQAMGSSSTVMYLAEQVDQAPGLSLVPLVAYPEAENPWAGLPEALATMAQTGLERPASSGTIDPVATADPPPSPHLSSTLDPPYLDVGTVESSDRPRIEDSVPSVPRSEAVPGSALSPPLVLPVIHEGVALGMLVSHRPQRPWSREERQQAEQVAQTLALAWILDQRGQWLQQQGQQRRLAQSAQSDTFHDLLHQFRNPLTALQTFGRLLVKRIPADDPNQTIAAGIVRESRRLQDLAQTFDETLAQGDADFQAESPPVPRVLGLFPPAAGRLLPESEAPGPTEPGDPSPAGPRWGRPLKRVAGSWVVQVRPLLQSASAIAQERGLHLVEQLPSDLPEVWMDPQALAEVLSNLLDNALKYAPAGSTIWVVAGLSQVVAGQPFQGIAVGDTGQGIPPADQSRLFERHFRGIQASGDIPGTGLGLAIAKDLMEDMGGYLDVVSPVPQGYQRVLTRGVDPATTYHGPGVCFIAWLAQV